MSPNIGVSRKCIEAFAHNDERRGVVDFVENDLEDLIYSGRKDERCEQLWGYNDDTPARRSISYQNWARLMSLSV